MGILEILNKINSSTKRTFKQKILEDNCYNDTLRGVFWAAYDTNLTYWISLHPSVDRHDGVMSLHDAINAVIDKLCNRKVTGNNAIAFYESILRSLSEDDATVLKRIIDRDLRCGVSIATVNKVWPGLIATHEVMLAASDPSNLKFPNVVVQPKLDGIRCEIKHRLDGEVEIRTRNGNQITSLEVLYDDVRRLIKEGETWDGELVCYNGDTPLPRKDSNGIANKAIRNTISDEEIKLLKFVCWDIIDKTQQIPYSSRLNSLRAALESEKDNGFIKFITSQQVDSLDDVKTLFEEAIERGEEGVIAKNINSFWEPKRSKNICKFKAENTCDLFVVDWAFGSGINENRLGALLCETSDGKIRVSVGSGFSNEDRDNITPDNSIGRVVEVLYNSVIEKRNGSVGSLYLPRFVKFRDDKSSANSIEEVK